MLNSMHRYLQQETRIMHFSGQINSSNIKYIKLIRIENNIRFLKRKQVKVTESLVDKFSDIPLYYIKIHKIMSKQEQPQQMLYQIRNLLISNTHTNRDEIKNVSDDQINKYLTQSFQLIKQDRISKTQKKHLDSKVSEASLLLNESSRMIKSYVKDKIQSEIFSGRKFKNNSQQYSKLMEMRQNLEKKRLQQKLEEENKINNMIQSARKFKKYQKVSEVPLPQLQSLIQREKIDFDKMNKQQHRLKSTNNLVQFSGFQIQNDVFINSTKKKKKKVTNQQNHDNVGSQTYIIQVQGTEEDEQHLFEKINEQYEVKMQETLKKNMNFVKAFVGFIHSQIRKLQNQKIIQSHQTQNIHFSVAQTKKKRFRFPDTLMREKTQVDGFGLGQVSKIFKFRGFLEQNQQLEEKIKIQPIKKVVSKRNGDSDKFHMKQCLIQANTFYYGDQQNDDQKLKKSEMKFFHIDIFPLQKITITRQERFVFQKKGNDIDAIVVKGKQRNFVYQLNLGEGIQLTQELNRIILKKYHKMSCLLNAFNNKNMEKFIEGEHIILDLSDKYIRPDQQHPVKNHKNSFIKMITHLFGKRRSTSIVNLQKCSLSFSEINSILKQCDEHFTNIQQINISKTKLDKETLKNILNLVKKCPASSTLHLNLSYCQLTDDILEANFALLQNLSPKIGYLDLSSNFITARSLRVLKSILSSKVCQIKVLNISGCPLEQIGQLTQMIRNSSKIQQIIANDCKFVIKASNQMQNLMLCTQQKPHLKKLYLNKNNYQGTFKWMEQISQNLQLKLDLSLKLISNKNLQSKYLRATLINNFK